MYTTPIPDDVIHFIQQHIDSIAHWEGLLLMRSQPDTGWTEDSLAQGLYISHTEASAVLIRLESLSFLQRQGDQFFYAPNTLEHVDLINRTAELYATQLIPITNLIHTSRKSRVQQFADAFRLRKD